MAAKPERMVSEGSDRKDTGEIQPSAEPISAAEAPASGAVTDSGGTAPSVVVSGWCVDCRQFLLRCSLDLPGPGAFNGALPSGGHRLGRRLQVCVVIGGARRQSTGQPGGGDIAQGAAAEPADAPRPWPTATGW